MTWPSMWTTALASIGGFCAVRPRAWRGISSCWSTPAVTASSCPLRRCRASSGTSPPRKTGRRGAGGFEAAFDHEEPPDQQKVIEEVIRDLTSPRPMDRLVCGDVGYGKTEVAIRAALKVVLDGRQAAVLVPTTVLAEQHYQTFRRRLSGYPVRVENLSRFQSKAGQARVAKDLAGGLVDIVLGTHRLPPKGASL